MMEPRETIELLHELIENGDAPGVEALLPSLRDHLRRLEYGDYPHYFQDAAGPDRPKRSFRIKPFPSLWDVAIGAGRDSVVRAMLGCGVNPKGRIANGETALVLATRRHLTSVVTMLLAAGAEPNLRSTSGASPLHYATDPEIVDLLLHAGAQIDVRDEDGDTPLMRRAYDGTHDTLMHLLRCGADPMIRTRYGQSLLSLLCDEANAELTLDVLEALVGAGYEVAEEQRRYGDYYARTSPGVDAFLESHGAVVGRSVREYGDFDIDVEQLVEAIDDERYEDVEAILSLFRNSASVLEDDWGPEALAAMVASGYRDGVAELLAMGVNPLNDSTRVENPINLAVDLGHPDPEIIRLLARSGAKLNAMNSEGISPLQEACRQNDDALVRLLLDLGADVGIRDRTGRTALFYARSVEAVRLLVEAGANVDERDADGATPLLTLSDQDASIITSLLEYGADVNARTFVDEAHPTAVYGLLASSIHTQRVDALRSLLGHGFDVRLHQDAFGDNYIIPVFDMPKGVAEELTTMLLAAGADVNHRDALDRSPLHYAAAPATAGPWHGVPIELLVESGADLEARDDAFDTPLLATVKIGHGERVTRSSAFGYGVRHFAKGKAARLGLDALPIPAPDEVEPKIVFRAGVIPPYSPAERLVALGADVNARDAAGRTPLIYAAAWGSLSVVSALLAAGADVLAEDVVGINPLLAAVNPNTPEGIRGRLETGVIEALLTAGADPYAATGLGVSAYEYVSRPHHTDAGYRELRAQWAEGT